MMQSWFKDAKLGIFVHWGVYAIPARGEWVRSYESLAEDVYQPHVETFNPVNYDP